MSCFSLSTGSQSTRPRPLQKRPRWYQAEPIDDPDSAAAPGRIRKGLLEGHWLSNDTLDYLGRSFVDLMRNLYRASCNQLAELTANRSRPQPIKRDGRAALTGCGKTPERLLFPEFLAAGAD